MVEEFSVAQTINSSELKYYPQLEQIYESQLESHERPEARMSKVVIAIRIENLADWDGRTMTSPSSKQKLGHLSINSPADHLDKTATTTRR